MVARARISCWLTVALCAVLGLAGLHRLVAAAEVRTHIVAIEGMKFSPPVLRIRAGDRVVFQNKDILPHTATAKVAKVFDSGPIKPGESWTIQPSGVEAIDYVCLYHPTMAGRIEIASP